MTQIKRKDAFLILSKAMKYSNDYEGIMILEKAVNRSIERGKRVLSPRSPVELSEVEYEKVISFTREFGIETTVQE